MRVIASAAMRARVSCVSSPDEEEPVFLGRESRIEQLLGTFSVTFPVFCVHESQSQLITYW